MEEIGRAVERLLTDETLTADVDDAAAKVLLRWGEDQLAAGRPEEQVRSAVKALARLVGKRASVDPAAARTRLEAAGLAVDDDTLTSLWAKDLPEGAWTQRLVGALVHIPPSPGTLTPGPLPPRPLPSPSPPASEDKGAIRQGDKETWWQRLFRRRRL
jgi:hypothetical protein